MKKICIIACYFGRLPNYFDEWILSCTKNETINFLLITDQNVEFKYSNIKVLKLSLEQLEIKIQKEYKYANLKSGYKVCDFRPMFGLIFEEELKGYDFWGHCDLDIIFGNIRKFISEKILDEYEKIFKWGHLSLYKNNKKMNEMFKRPGGVFDYKEVFSSKNFYAFDEVTGIYRILKKNFVKTYEEEVFFNASRKFKELRTPRNSKIQNYEKQVFYWENGGVYRGYIDGNMVKIDEFLYIHLQWKKPKVNLETKKEERFYISSAEIFTKKYSGNIKKEEIISFFEMNSKKIKIDEVNYYFKMCITFFKSTKEQKRIWFRQKLKK